MTTMGKNLPFVKILSLSYCVRNVINNVCVEDVMNLRLRFHHGYIFLAIKNTSSSDYSFDNG